jgi:hypothetical protein
VARIHVCDITYTRDTRGRGVISLSLTVCSAVLRGGTNVVLCVLQWCHLVGCGVGLMVVGLLVWFTTDRLGVTSESLHFLTNVCDYQKYAVPMLGVYYLIFDIQHVGWCTRFMRWVVFKIVRVVRRIQARIRVTRGLSCCLSWCWSYSGGDGVVAGRVVSDWLMLPLCWLLLRSLCWFVLLSLLCLALWWMEFVFMFPMNVLGLFGYLVFVWVCYALCERLCKRGGGWLWGEYELRLATVSHRVDYGSAQWPPVIFKNMEPHYYSHTPHTSQNTYTQAHKHAQPFKHTHASHARTHVHARYTHAWRTIHSHT